MAFYVGTGPDPKRTTTYNPYAYVRGGAPMNVAYSTQEKGYATGTPITTGPKVSAPAPPPPAAQTPAVPPGGTTTPKANPNYDYSNDPILQLAVKDFGKNESEAQANLLANQKRFLIGFGSRQLAEKILGSTDPTAQAAADNPFSTLANLGYQFGLQRNDTNEAMNANNLFWSSSRANELAKLGREQLNQQSQATNSAEQTLADLQSGFNQQMAQFRAAKLAAEEAAYQRALQQAETSPPSPDASQSNPVYENQTIGSWTGPVNPMTGVPASMDQLSGIPTPEQIASGQAEPLWKQIQRQLGLI